MTRQQVKNSAADANMQKELGMAAQAWRDANARAGCARSLSWGARRRADTHTAAAADARKAMLDPRRNEVSLAAQGVMYDHRQTAEQYLAIAGAHTAVAERARAVATFYARMLINKLTPELMRQRLSALEPGIAATITRLFGDNLADARTRARVFEACDFAQWEGGIDEYALTKHKGISKTREYV